MRDQGSKSVLQRVGWKRYEEGFSFGGHNWRMASIPYTSFGPSYLATSFGLAYTRTRSWLPSLHEDVHQQMSSKGEVTFLEDILEGGVTPKIHSVAIQIRLSFGTRRRSVEDLSNVWFLFCF